MPSQDDLKAAIAKMQAQNVPEAQILAWIREQTRPSLTENPTEYFTGMAKNFPGSLGRVGLNLAKTPYSLYQLAGELEKTIYDPSRAPGLLSNIGGALKDRYWDNLSKTAYEDPAGLLTDVASLAAGGAGATRMAAVRAGAPRVARAAEVAGQVSAGANPANWYGKAIRTVGRQPLQRRLQPGAALTTEPVPLGPNEVPAPLAGARATPRPARPVRGAGGVTEAVMEHGSDVLGRPNIAQATGTRQVLEREAATQALHGGAPNLRTRGVTQQIAYDPMVAQVQATTPGVRPPGTGYTALHNRLGQPRGLGQELTPPEALGLQSMAEEGAHQLRGTPGGSATLTLEEATAAELENALRRGDPTMGPILSDLAGARTAERAVAGIPPPPPRTWRAAAGPVAAATVGGLGSLMGAGAAALPATATGLALGGLYFGGRAALQNPATAGMLAQGSRVLGTGLMNPAMGGVLRGGETTTEAIRRELEQRQLAELLAQQQQGATP